MSQSLSLIEINFEEDLVTARQRARQVARLLSFDEQDQTRTMAMASRCGTSQRRQRTGRVIAAVPRPTSLSRCDLFGSASCSWLDLDREAAPLQRQDGARS